MPPYRLTDKPTDPPKYKGSIPGSDKTFTQIYGYTRIGKKIIKGRGFLPEAFQHLFAGTLMANEQTGLTIPVLFSVLSIELNLGALGLGSSTRIIFFVDL